MYAYCGNNPAINCDSAGCRYAVHADVTSRGHRYIFDQTSSEIGQKQFRNSTIAHSGCSVVATYNALLTLGASRDVEEIIPWYEQHGNPIFGGLAGVPYRAVADYFLEAGYDVSMHTDVELFSYLAAESDASVIWYTWINSSNMGMHFFHVNSFAGFNRGYNVYSNENATRNLPTNLSDFFSGSNGRYAVIICINRR